MMERRPRQERSSRWHHLPLLQPTAHQHPWLAVHINCLPPTGLEIANKKCTRQEYILHADFFLKKGGMGWVAGSKGKIYLFALNLYERS